MIVHEVQCLFQIYPVTVLPVLPSLHDCLSNRWKVTPFYAVSR